MTRQDIEALMEMDKWLSTQYNQTNGLKRNEIWVSNLGIRLGII